MKIISTFLLFLIASFVSASESQFTHLGKDFRVFRAKPEEVRLVWKGEQTKPLLSFRAALQELAKEGKEVVMLTNGGIFEPRHIPSGLYLEKGKTLRPLNLKRAKGNFFLKPNAVFYLTREGDATTGGVVESGAFSKWPAEKKEKLWYAVQSGPALLLDGEKHPAFNRDSKNELLRNGVGVTEEGEVLFVITSQRKDDCNLWTFADCFRALGCQNALFLDGDISQMKVNPKADVKGHGFATMFGVVR